MKPRIESKRITTALEKHRCRETSVKTSRYQGRRGIPMAWHLCFNTATFRRISIPTEIGFRKTTLININCLFALFCLLLKCREILFAFYWTLFFVGLRLFFRVILSFFNAYQIPCFETPKWAARSCCVASGKSATCCWSAS